MSIFELVEDQCKLIEEGRVLDVFERYFHDDIMLISNGEVFASSKTEGMRKQKEFFSSVSEMHPELRKSLIKGDKVVLDFDYQFVMKSGEKVKFRGLHVQQWKGEKMLREEFFSGKNLEEELQNVAFYE